MPDAGGHDGGHSRAPSNLDLNSLDGELLRADGQEYDRSQRPILGATRDEKVADEEVLQRARGGRFR